jgi:tRNA(Ile)-lysidine synthase TilS/MesJ
MNIETQVKQTLKKIKLDKKDRILVALSGGKDSTVTAYLLKKLGYNIEGFHINLGMGGYSERCLEAVKQLCKQLDIKLHLYDIKKEMGSSMCYIRSAIQHEKKGLKNCAICGVIKKWIMNKEARKLKVDKIATGHNLDDEAQTFFMNVFKGSLQLSANSGAITKNVRDKKFITRIKPLFYVAENDIREYSRKMKLPVVYEKCPCALDSYRIQIREFINTLTTEEKMNIMKNFDILFPRIQKLKTEEKLNYCEICGEPSRNKICKMCQLVGK